MGRDVRDITSLVSNASSIKKNATKPDNVQPSKTPRKNRKKYKNLKILYFNCQGLANETRLYELENALQSTKYDIIGLSEIKRCGERMIVRNNGNVFYYYGETIGYRGVGFYISNRLVNHISEIKGVSERIACLKMKVDKNTNLLIIQVYAPTTVAEEKITEEFYKLLEETYEKEKEYYTIIMGDWNAKIGNEGQKHPNIGKFTIGNTNENGEKLINFMLKFNLKLGGSYFKKRAGRKWTWLSPDGNTKNEIDHPW